ncbi:MAG: WYL domain-containing protein [Bacteroidota bacterium]|nr:WYL domain-containing protein [Bacteroidota bacterium]
MPRNKEALIRYRVINRCLIGGKIVSKEKLMQACEDALDIHPLGERTLDGDIHDMRYDNRLAYNAPIKFDRLKGGYFYEDPDYSVDKIPLNEEELENLVFASTILDQFKYLDIFSGFTGTVQKIIDAVNIRRMKKEAPDYDFIDFEKVPYIKGSQFLQKLIEAIRGNTVILLRYQPFYEDKPYLVHLHPYLLKEYRNRWYVIGLNEEVKEIRTYGLDRIQLIEYTDMEYIPKDFGASEYFKNTVGVISPPGPPPEIYLEVLKPQSSYLITKALHESQQIVEENDEKVIFRLKVHPTYEFKVLILGLGNDARILKPKSLRDDVARTLRLALREYSQG